MNDTTETPESQAPPTLLISPSPRHVYKYFDCCPRAQTLLAYSLTHSQEILYVLPCRTWSCRPCAERKIKQMACTVRDVQPNRLLTLTVNPSLYESRKESWQKTVKQVPILIRRLRSKFGSIEYLRVTEVTSKGWPHYHLLVKSGYLPHSVVKNYWSEQTGAFIVDLRCVAKSFSAYKYLVKYLSKLHSIEWTARHVSRSKGFRSPNEWENPNPIETAEPTFVRSHPAHVAMERYDGQFLRRLSPGAYLIDRSDDHVYSREELDLLNSQSVQGDLFDQPPPRQVLDTCSPHIFHDLTLAGRQNAKQ